MQNDDGEGWCMPTFFQRKYIYGWVDEHEEMVVCNNRYLHMDGRLRERTGSEATVAARIRLYENKYKWGDTTE